MHQRPNTLFAHRRGPNPGATAGKPVRRAGSECITVAIIRQRREKYGLEICGFQGVAATVLEVGGFMVGDQNYDARP